MKSQQRQTAEYFRRSAGGWPRKADGALPATVNLIRQRNEFVPAVAGELEKPGRALDLGCGTGELECDLVELGFQAVGVDSSPEMIGLCEQKKADDGAEAAMFLQDGVFHLQLDGASIDLVCTALVPGARSW